MRDPFKAICDDDLERRWIWISLIMAFVMGGLLGLYAVGANLHPPSNVETIDSSRLHLTEEFAEDNLGVKDNGDGSLTVTIAESFDVSQPAPFSRGETVITPRSDIAVEEGASRMFPFGPATTIDEIVRAVNEVGAAPGDLAAILEALHALGALRAELIVI